MTKIIIVTIFGRRDEAATRLQGEGMTLTIENTVEVSSKHIESALLKLWQLAAEGVIGEFRVKAEDISA